MLYNLRNGKTIELSTEDFFFLSDDDLNQLEGAEMGESIEHPFFNSVLGADTSPLNEDTELSLTSIPYAVKFSDLALLEEE